jgi:hypothetical protein
MTNKSLFVYTNFSEEVSDIFEIQIFPSGIKIFQDEKFLFFVVENNQIKEVTE